DCLPGGSSTANGLSAWWPVVPGLILAGVLGSASVGVLHSSGGSSDGVPAGSAGNSNGNGGSGIGSSDAGMAQDGSSNLPAGSAAGALGSAAAAGSAAKPHTDVSDGNNTGGTSVPGGVGGANAQQPNEAKQGLLATTGANVVYVLFGGLLLTALGAVFIAVRRRQS
ncbi:hypothetical protein M0E84_11655, partial [Corynebacterium sp. CCM 9186]|nr:hypothetical protein [Corynebacterium meridianum]